MYTRLIGEESTCEVLYLPSCPPLPKHVLTAVYTQAFLREDPGTFHSSLPPIIKTKWDGAPKNPEHPGWDKRDQKTSHPDKLLGSHGAEPGAAATGHQSLECTHFTKQQNDFPKTARLTIQHRVLSEQGCPPPQSQVTVARNLSDKHSFC